MTVSQGAMGGMLAMFARCSHRPYRRPPPARRACGPHRFPALRFTITLPVRGSQRSSAATAAVTAHAEHYLSFSRLDAVLWRRLCGGLSPAVLCFGAAAGDAAVCLLRCSVPSVERQHHPHKPSAQSDLPLSLGQSGYFRSIGTLTTGGARRLSGESVPTYTTLESRPARKLLRLGPSAYWSCSVSAQICGLWLIADALLMGLSSGLWAGDALMPAARDTSSTTGEPVAYRAWRQLLYSAAYNFLGSTTDITRSIIAYPGTLSLVVSHGTKVFPRPSLAEFRCQLLLRFFAPLRGMANRWQALALVRLEQLAAAWGGPALHAAHSRAGAAAAPCRRGTPTAGAVANRHHRRRAIHAPRRCLPSRCRPTSNRR